MAIPLPSERCAAQHATAEWCLLEPWPVQEGVRFLSQMRDVTVSSAAAAAADVLQVSREDHFAAVKNAPGSATDSPDTARAAMLAQGTRWVAAAGGQLAAGCEGVEVSPLVSYAGEGLQQLVQGVTLQVCCRRREPWSRTCVRHLL